MNSVYKTTDGGEHWSPTGDGAFQNLALDVADIVMHPVDTATVFAATQLGLYRSLNGGTTWTLIISGEFQELEFHPTRPDTIYAVKRVGDKTEFYRSVDGGATFQIHIDGWPDPNTDAGEHQRRVELSVSPDAPDDVYALATGSANGGSGLYGVYVSTDDGETWTFTCCGPQPAGPPSLDNPNLMGWSSDGTGDGGQYYYDLAFAVSPTNADTIYVCGVNLWVSGDGGNSFVCPSNWSESYKPEYVHADIHDIHFTANPHEIWVACDGGIFYSSDAGADFNRRVTGIEGTDFWGFGAGFWDGDVMLGGTYHNGTLLSDDDVYENGWISTDGGDNYRGFVNPGKEKEVYSDYNVKKLSGDRMVNNATRSFAHKPNASYIVGASSDVLFHPQYYGTWYTGSDTVLWKTEDDGYTFTLIHNFGEDIAAMDISWSNPNVIYVCTWPDWGATKHIYRTEDGGSTWVDITPSSGQLGGNTWVPYDIAVDAQNPMRVWIVRTSMYGDTNLDGVSVFKSDDGGNTWQNWSTSTINGEAFTCIAHQAGTNGGVYLGTRETVYYRNATMNDWAWCGDGLPAATFSTRLIPYYREGKLRNGTNRSVWESPFYENSSPVAQPSVLDHRHNCVADTVYFVDHSVISETDASWYWEFPGGTPATSSERDPRVLYSAPGIYSVTLAVSDVNGTDTATVFGIVEVRNECALDTVPGNALKCTALPDYALIPDLGVTTNTFTISAWVKPNGIQNDYTGIVMSDGIACGFNFREGNNTLGYHWGGDGNAWSWDSNLEVPADQWSHVAMVITPTTTRLYVNGKEAVQDRTHAAQTISTMKIGSYQAWQARNFNGLIDEVCIWNRSLTKEEIRATRHLTKMPADDPDLLAYYQFNEENSIIYDKAHDHDGVINGGAQKVRSRVPVGSGVSQSLEIDVPGVYDFDETGLTIAFPDGAMVPQGIVYASRLNVLPDSLVTGDVPMMRGYWILNNYGSNEQVSPPDTVVADNLAFISGAMRDSLDNAMYERSDNAAGIAWHVVTDENGMAVAGESGAVTYPSTNASFRSLGQLMVVRDSMRYGKPQVALTEPWDTNVLRRGASSAALMVQSAGKGVLLPQYASDALQDVPSPASGSIAYLTDLHEIACFDGTLWQVLTSDYLEPPVYVGLPETDGVSLGGGSTLGGLLGFGTEAGLLLLSDFEVDSLMNIDFPKEGLLVYREDIGRLAYYDGINWVYPGVQPPGMSASTETPTQDIPGVRIGPGVKDPNALLQILDTRRGLAIPVMPCNEVINPQEGLVVFDPRTGALSLFDGVGWKMVR